MPIITLTTDFGTRDGYVGAMKGVLVAAAPDLRIVDITHRVPPFDVAAAAFALAQAAPYFPDGTIHVVVVDPGVGGARRAVIIDDSRQRYVGPDNGVFALAVPSPAGAWEITSQAFRRGTVSGTFHGRDVFAPAAARLATGAAPSEAGKAVELEGRLPGPPAKKGAAGRVVHVDRFGNLVTDIAAARLPEKSRVTIGKVKLAAILRTYEDVPKGKPVAYVGSAGTLEIALREGSFADKHKLGVGASVFVS